MSNWHNVNETTKLTTFNLYIFISTKEKTGKFKYQVISNNGTELDTWRSRFSSHNEIKEQVEIFIDDIKNAGEL